MPSKKNILFRLSQIEKDFNELKKDVKEHYSYEPKDVIIQDIHSDLKVEILANGWTSIIAEDGEKRISLGNYPNKRFEILEEMFKRLKEIAKEKIE